MINMIKRINILLLTFFPLTMVFATTLNVPKKFKAEFTQIHQSILKNKMVKSEGYFLYAYPKKIKIEITSPKEKRFTFINNAEKSWTFHPPFIDGEKGTLKEGEGQSSPLIQILDGLSNSKQNKTIKLTEQKDYLKLEFISDAISKQTNIKMAKIYFNQKKSKDFHDVDKIIYEKNDGRETTLDFSKIESQDNLSDKTFSWDP